MNLSKTQRTLLMMAKERNDFCVRGNHQTMASLVKKGLAQRASGFGFSHGEIIQLTDNGRQELFCLTTRVLDGFQPVSNGLEIKRFKSSALVVLRKRRK